MADRMIFTTARYWDNLDRTLYAYINIANSYPAGQRGVGYMMTLDCVQPKKASPTLVLAYKDGGIGADKYTDVYVGYLDKNREAIIKDILYTAELPMYKGKIIALMCWCSKHSFCHRYLLIQWMQAQPEFRDALFVSEP
jgi:hypothetical protein